MKKKLITAFFILFNFVHMYYISGNTTINRGVDVELGGEVTIRNSFLDYYLGPDYAPVIMAVLSIFGIILFNNILGREKHTLISNIEIFLVMLLLNLIMFRLRVNIMY